MRPLVLTIAVVGLALAGGAVAARTPSSGEAEAIRSAIVGFIAMPNSPAAKDNKIVAISVSTLDRRYAAARLNSKSAGPSELVLHLSMGTWWIEEFGSSLGCYIGPRSVLDDLKIGCMPPGAAAWINNCGPLVRAPKSLVLACGDGNYELAGLSWHSWGNSTATASGKARANDCTPNCAAGHFHTYPVTVTVSRLRPCGRARYYARLAISYAGKRPAGIAKRDVLTLGC